MLPTFESGMCARVEVETALIDMVKYSKVKSTANYSVNIKIGRMSIAVVAQCCFDYIITDV